MCLSCILRVDLMELGVCGGVRTGDWYGDLPFTGSGNTAGGLTGPRVGILTAPLVMHVTHPDGDILYTILELKGAWAAHGN